VKVVVNKDEEYASAQARESSALKEECEADLAEALPALNAALSALDTLKVICFLFSLYTFLDPNNYRSFCQTLCNSVVVDKHDAQMIY